ncbi:MAG: hypothetical protein Q7R65_02370 [bacterium]|nr:hypothetical protein [bacterium]
MSEVTLGQLIERWLVPVKGRQAQVELIRFMSKELKIGPDVVAGFPTIHRVREEIKKRLSIRLLEGVQVKPGDEVTYFPRSISYDGSVCGWGTGKKYRVVRINQDRITIDDAESQNSQAVPLYCLELLAQIGAHVDFEALNKKAKALG